MLPDLAGVRCSHTHISPCGGRKQELIVRTIAQVGLPKETLQLWLTRNPTTIVTDCSEATSGAFSCLSACSCHKQHGLQSKERLEDKGGGLIEYVSDCHSNKSSGQEIKNRREQGPCMYSTAYRSGGGSDGWRERKGFKWRVERGEVGHRLF